MEEPASHRTPSLPAPGRACAHCGWPTARTKYIPKQSRNTNSVNGGSLLPNRLWIDCLRVRRFHLGWLPAGLQTAHAAQPSVVISSLVSEVFRDFRMRKDQEALLREPLYRRFGNLLRLAGRFHQKRGCARFTRDQHVRADS